MKNCLILYYTKTGNSRFLAEQLAVQLPNSSLREIRPNLNVLPIVFLLSAMKISTGTGIRNKDLEGFNEVVLIGPIWGGLLIGPLRAMLKKLVRTGKPIHFAVTCETDDAQKDDDYGYAQVLNEAKKIGGNLIHSTEAFPTPLVKEGDSSWTPKMSDKIKLTEDNFKGSIATRLQAFAEQIRG